MDEKVLFSLSLTGGENNMQDIERGANNTEKKIHFHKMVINKLRQREKKKGGKKEKENKELQNCL